MSESTSPGLRAGEQLRDQALGRVERHKPTDTWRAQQAMLVAMIDREDHRGTSDDMSAPGVQYKGNAPWIGAAVRGLAERGLIVRDGNVKSTRPSRHANEVKQWRLANPETAAGEAKRLGALLAAITTAAELEGAP